MSDKVGNVGLPDDWSEGIKIWDVPIGWNSESHDPPVKEVNPNVYKQRFEIFNDGTLRIDKHGNWISRSLNDHIHLNGVRVK